MNTITQKLKTYTHYDIDIEMPELKTVGKNIYVGLPAAHATIRPRSEEQNAVSISSALYSPSYEQILWQYGLTLSAIQQPTDQRARSDITTCDCYNAISNADLKEPIASSCILQPTGLQYW